MRVGVLTGGGDCPGLNAVIRAVTKSLISQCGAEVIGIEDGFAGLLSAQPRTRALDWGCVSDILMQGGTILGTSNKANPMATAAHLQQALSHIRVLGLNALVVIGGDGTMAIAHRLASEGVAVVGVPKTIDNDIVGCERSFGFDTAVATAAQALERLQTTGQSHSRIMILETMGRYAGWIALEAGIAGAADVILLPEIDYDIEAVAQHCRAREQRERYTVICVGEGAKPQGGALTVERRLTDSPDPIRLGGVAHALRDQLQPYVQSEVRATVLGHVQRGGTPTPFDRVLATQYGHHAAQLVMQGCFQRMVTLTQGTVASIPLGDVAHQCRQIPPTHPLLQMAEQIGVCLGRKIG